MNSFAFSAFVLDPKFPNKYEKSKIFVIKVKVFYDNDFVQETSAALGDLCRIPLNIRKRKRGSQQNYENILSLIIHFTPTANLKVKITQLIIFLQHRDSHSKVSSFR